MKLKMIALAAALVASTSSIAAIAPGGTGNGELFLAVFDSSAKVSYTLDLGVRMDDFFVDGQALAGYNRDWGVALPDGNFSSFLSQTTAANLRWVVMAVDTFGPTSAGGQRLFTTVRDGTADAVVASPTNSQFSNGVGAAQTGTFIDNVNATGTHSIRGDTPSLSDYAVNGSSVNAEADPTRTYFAEAGAPGNNFSNQFLALRTDNAVGTSASFWYLTRSNTSGSFAVLTDRFNAVAEDGSITQNGAFTLTADANGYNLNYNLQPVPEASTYAMLLAGLGAVGMVARRRRIVR